MKKCPKCGTILDDSKKKCYMCGADLTKKIEANFAESFDAKIGAQTTRAQDNVFNNGVDIKAKGKDMVGRNSNGVFYSNNSPQGFFNKGVPVNNNMPQGLFNKGVQINKGIPSSNGFQGFGNPNAQNRPNMMNNQRPNSVQQVNEQVKVSANRKKDDNGADPTIMNFFEKNRAYQNNGPSNPPKQVQKKVEKAPKVQKTDSPENFKINFNFIFNTLCFIVFLGLILFGYLKFIKPKQDNKDTMLNKLYYVMDKSMSLTQSDKYSKYYTRGEACAIKITYGETTDVDGFTDNYFDQIRAEYTNDHNHLTRSEEFKINDNKWSSLSVLEITPNPASTGGFSTITKYKYISIVKDGNYYTIIYANTDNDNNCSKAYEDFINTLDFR